MTSEFLYNPQNVGSYCHCATLIKTQSGDLLAAWHADPEEEYKDAQLVLARQVQEPTGPRWVPSQTILPPSVYSTGNPVLFLAPTGRIYLFFVGLKGSYWNDADLQAVSSDNDGHTWTDPISLHLPAGTMVRGTPLVGGHDERLLPVYEERTKHAILLVSEPPYRTWRVGYRFEDPPLIQPTLVREAHEGLTMYFRATKQPKKIWRSVSSNDGKSWSVPIQTPLPNPLSRISAVTGGGHRIDLQPYNRTSTLSLKGVHYTRYGSDLESTLAFRKC